MCREAQVPRYHADGDSLSSFQDGRENERADGSVEGCGVIHHGRWQDTLPGTYDPALAVVITDPPYGLEASNGSGNRARGAHVGGKGMVDTRKGHETGKGYADIIPWADHVTEVLKLLPARRHVIRGPATALIRRDYPEPRRVCVELSAYRRRAMHRPGVVPYLWQGWAIYGRLQIERHKSPPRGDALTVTQMWRDPRDHRPQTDHRALTPFTSAAWIIDTWADPGCLVIDPFAGLGTIGLAAAALGFPYLGAELVPEYFAVASDALAIERPTMDLSA